MIDTIIPPTNTDPKVRPKAPLHFWVVGVLALLWNVGGGFHYVMMVSGNQDYLSQFTPEQLVYFTGFPNWLVTVWAIAVWSAIAGSILLLLRNRLAAQVFMISLGAVLVTMGYHYFLSGVSALEIIGLSGMIFSAIIVIVTVLLIWYARVMAAKGVLR